MYTGVESALAGLLIAAWAGVSLVCGAIGWGIGRLGGRLAGQRAGGRARLGIAVVSAVVCAALPSLAGYATLKQVSDRQREQLRARARVMDRITHKAQAYIDAACPTLPHARVSAGGARPVALQVALSRQPGPGYPAGDMYSAEDRRDLAEVPEPERTDAYLREARAGAAPPADWSRPPAGETMAALGLDYLEYDKGSELFGIATPAFWLAPTTPLGEAARAEIARATQGHTGPFGYKPDRTAATHRLEVADVSTLDDREHWVRRVDARLLDARSGELLSARHLLLPAALDYVRPLRLCSTSGPATYRDERFDWLAYLVNEV